MLKEIAATFLLLGAGSALTLAVLLMHPTIRRIGIAWLTYTQLRDSEGFTSADGREWLRLRTFETMTGEIDIYGNRVAPPLPAPEGEDR